jgi:hypothetical protein
MPRQTLGRTLRRIRGLHFPPWVPVVFIIVVVFGILGALFLVRSATGAPRQGDNWSAAYQIVICGESQPNVPTWEGGVNTYGDGLIHIHPSVADEEGKGARLVKWFEYGGNRLGTGAKLTKTELQVPGQSEVWKNGDECPDGTQGVLQVFVNDKKMDDWSGYIPQDGDQIRIVFGPEEGAGTGTEGESSPQAVGTATPEAEATAETG